MSRIMRELVAEGRKARGETLGPNPPGEWPFPDSAVPTPAGARAVCIHGIGVYDRCYACGRWGGTLDGDGDTL